MVWIRIGLIRKGQSQKVLNYHISLKGIQSKLKTPLTIEKDQQWIKKRVKDGHTDYEREFVNAKKNLMCFWSQCYSERWMMDDCLQRPVCYYGMSVKSLHRFKCSSIWSLESIIIWGGRIFWTRNLVVRLRVVLMDLYAPNIMPQGPYLFAMFPCYDGFNACEPNVFLSFSRFLLAVGCRT